MFGSINFLDLELLKYSFEYHIPNYNMSPHVGSAFLHGVPGTSLPRYGPDKPMF